MMASRTIIDDVREFALSLPEASEAPHFSATSFRVGGKIFSTLPPEETHLHIFVGDQRRERALSMYPEFCEKLWWGKKVVGVRVLLASADPLEIKDLLRCAWRSKAPKALLDKEDDC
jgi:hypothetical protein